MSRTLRLRTSLGWPQTRMADHLGVSQPTVVRLEAGQHEPGPVRRLLDLLEAEIESGGQGEAARQELERSAGAPAA